MQLLVECARTRPDAAAIRRAAASVDDWNALLQSAVPHGMTPLLYWALHQACPDAVPAAVLARLRTEFYFNGLRNRRFSGELVRLVSLLEAAGVEVVPFKGPALAWGLYEDPALRHMCDLDLLVRPSHVERAMEVLIAAGYQPSYTADRWFFRWGRELPLFSPEAGIAVDLHWALTPAHFAHAMPVGRLYPRLVNVAVAGGAVRTFANRDLLLFLCLHAAKHCWCSLTWLADLVRLAGRGGLDWDGVMADARERRMSRALFASLLLAVDVLGAAVPDWIVATARADSISVKLAARAQDRLLHAAEAPGRLDRYALQLALLERAVDKFQFCWRHFQPEVADLLCLRLPAVLYPAYYALRPLRLMAKYAGRLMPPAPAVTRLTTNQSSAKSIT